MILYDTIGWRHKRYTSGSILVSLFNVALYSCLVEFGCWQSNVGLVLLDILAWRSSLFSKSQTINDDQRARNLRQETNLLQKITHLNNNPCPSQHQRSLVGKHTLNTTTSGTIEWGYWRYCNSWRVTLAHSEKQYGQKVSPTLNFPFFFLHGIARYRGCSALHLWKVKGLKLDFLLWRQDLCVVWVQIVSG